MNPAKVAVMALHQLDNFDHQGYCVMCRRRVGSLNPGNDTRHAPWCAIHGLRQLVNDDADQR